MQLQRVDGLCPRGVSWEVVGDEVIAPLRHLQLQYPSDARTEESETYLARSDQICYQTPHTGEVLDLQGSDLLGIHRPLLQESSRMLPTLGLVAAQELQSRVRVTQRLPDDPLHPLPPFDCGAACGRDNRGDEIFLSSFAVASSIGLLSDHFLEQS